MSDQAGKQRVEALVVHFKSGTTARANVVPGSVTVRLRNVTGELIGIGYESYPNEDELVFIDPSQVNAVVIERWEHPDVSAEDGDDDE